MALRPQPSPEVLDRVYSHEYFDAWGSASALEANREMKRQTFQRQLSSLTTPSPGWRLLDCGAAFGFLMDAAEEMGFRAYGIELIASAAESALRRYDPDRIVIGSFEQASEWGEGYFHAITMSDFIEHVRDPRMVLEKTYSLLVDGGELLIITPDVGSVSRRLMRGSWPHFSLEHLTYFTRQSMTRLLHDSGFDVLHVGPAVKALSARYLSSQLDARARHPIKLGLSRVLSFIPDAMANTTHWVKTGQMQVLARKRP